MVRIELSIELHYDVGQPGADFVFNIHGAYTGCQIIQSESLSISQTVPSPMRPHITATCA